MIASFADGTTAAIFLGRSPKKGFPSSLLPAAHRKLAAINAARSLDDLRAPPSNELHALQGDRAGPWAIWINTQRRICFVWRDGTAHDVAITDDH